MTAASPFPLSHDVPADWVRWYEASRAQVDDALEHHLNNLRESDPANSSLIDSVCYSLGLPGKRLRPILVLESCRVCGGSARVAMPAALAIECVHAFSLVHDDLPAMDNDDLRRGQPTNHKVFGEATAVLAGDWLVTHAFALLAPARREPRLAAELVRTLAEATLGMIAGQAADIAGESQAPDEVLVRYIHRNKTAQLIEASCRIGAVCAGASCGPTAALARFGHHLGLAFQIVDDLLDLLGDEAEVGKSLGRDLCEGELTLPVIHYLANANNGDREELRAVVRGDGTRCCREIASLLRESDSIDYARSAARHYVGKAQENLDTLAPSAARDSLSTMADFILARRR